MSPPGNCQYRFDRGDTTRSLILLYRTKMTIERVFYGKKSQHGARSLLISLLLVTLVCNVTQTNSQNISTTRHHPDSSSPSHKLDSIGADDERFTPFAYNLPSYGLDEMRRKTSGKRQTYSLSPSSVKESDITNKATTMDDQQQLLRQNTGRESVIRREHPAGRSDASTYRKLNELSTVISNGETSNEISPESAPSSVNSSRLLDGSKSALDDEIKTISLLIDMLRLADKRLRDQRRNLGQPMNSISHQALRTALDNPLRRQEELGGKNMEQLTDSSVVVPTKLELSFMNTTKKSTESKKVKKRKSTSNKQVANKSMESDLSFVKPGFDSEQITSSSTGSRLERRHEPFPLMGYHPQQAQLDLSGAARAHLASVQHRPMAAHDLLEVARLQRPAQPGLFVSHEPGGHQTRRHPFDMTDHGVGPQHKLNLPSIPNHGPISGGFQPLAQQIEPDKPASGGTDFTPGSHLQPHEIHRHLMEASKRQQDAAMAFERRRLGHSLEMARRQEILRRLYEISIERQRQQEEARKTTQKGSQTETPTQSLAGHKEVANQEKVEHAQEDPEEPNEELNALGKGNLQPIDGMKSLREFAGAGDFTDLFPPGILSPEEIQEMQRQSQQADENEDSSKQNEAGNEEEEEEEREETNAGKENGHVGESPERAATGNQSTRGAAIATNQADSSGGSSLSSGDLADLLTKIPTASTRSLDALKSKRHPPNGGPEPISIKPSLLEPASNYSASSSGASLVPTFILANATGNLSAASSSNGSPATSLTSRSITNKQRRSSKDSTEVGSNVGLRPMWTDQGDSENQEGEPGGQSTTDDSDINRSVRFDSDFYEPISVQLDT